MIQFELHQIFPAFLLADKNGYAIAKGIARGLEMMCEIAQTGFDWVEDIDKMPEWRLDELAWEYAVEWYDYGMTTQEKRAHIRDATPFYRQQGTPASVIRAIEAICNGKLEEWFDYDGEPYHFRVTTSRLAELAENQKKFFGLVEQTQNLRSQFDGVSYNKEPFRASLFFGAAIYETKTVTYTEYDRHGVVKAVWLVDEKGNTLVDEALNVLVDEGGL